MASAATAKEMGRASYIWIKHEEERREASWKETEGRVFSATTRTDVAALLISEPRDQILAGRASFADLAAHHSGCWGLKRTPVHALFWWISLRSGGVRRNAKPEKN
ncbi:peptidyl-prolyl cis-trans isomerase Pin1-like [Triticum dicoccoides]|uniref:peptidyl-prolyl cis-trans isomerase Pin1-like n=1 Tax=Triticum dicoccoides TaxID=85692 RepID=UPI00188EE544|nr:peptidyl-prolyl cis-trans isomerase Pin1-like [Triticum dicoccoides]